MPVAVSNAPISNRADAGAATSPGASPRLLRLLTCGSVDDGKSTLIGRLLYDSRAVFSDQLAAVESASRRRGDETIDLSLFTDGLRWEREQGITIDVAYRYFSTANRQFILIDSPGHVQYTRNMVTGASNADAAVILVDVRHGVQEQTHRHAYLVSLLGIRRLIVAVNKMDTAGWDPSAYESVRENFERFRAELGDLSISYVPISALHGDNVVSRSIQAPWYSGPTMLELLEAAPTRDLEGDGPVRFPVQWIIRPRGRDTREPDFRGYAGAIESGTIRVGDRLVAMSTGKSSKVESIRILDDRLSECRPPQSVILELADDIDIGRGELLSSPDSKPTVARDLSATVVWMGPAPLQTGKRYLLRHTTHFTPAVVTSIDSRLDVATLKHGDPTATLQPNDIGLIKVRTAAPIFVDPYTKCRSTGAFVLIDEATNDTAGAGLVKSALS